jgi:hypothetical protein
MKFTAILLALSAASTSAQGLLTPPAALAPSMKTLDQIEARTPIPASLGAPNAGPYFTISQPGSYYLTGNITVSNGSAIVISAGVNGVTLDLNGFTVSSTLAGSHTGNAIEMPGSHSGITIRRGNIASGTKITDSGVVTAAGFDYGISGGNLQNVLVTEVHVSGVAIVGIQINNGTISECTAYNCGYIGLLGETVTNSSSDSCKDGGISATNATNCIGTTIRGYGLASDTAINCTGTSNSDIGVYCFNATNCTGTSTSGVGLSCQRNATNCTGTSTSGDGLTCDGNATNCNGTTNSASSNAVTVTSTASSCRGTNTAGGTALSAAIAIGCTTGGGVIVSSQKHLGTP